AELDSFAPLVEVELAFGQPHVDSAQANLFTIDTGEIGFATDLGSIAAVQRVVPDVELPGGWCVDAGDEIDGVMHDVDNVFVGADAVVWGHVVAGQLEVVGFEPPTRMREADDAALRLTPFEDGEIPARPFFDAGRARIVVFLEPEEAQMAGVRGGKSGDFDIV